MADQQAPNPQGEQPQISPDYSQFMEQNQVMLTNMMKAFIQAQNHAPTVKLPTPPTYSGNRNASEIDAWIRLIDKQKLHNEWTDERTYNFASSLLSGRAATIVAHHEDPNSHFTTPTTWTALKEILINNFRPSNDQDLARDVLVTIRQTNSIRDYVDRFMDAVIPIKDIGEREQCDRFMRGLKDKDLIASIRAMPIESRTLERLFSDALAYEFAHHPEISAGVQTNTRYNINSDVQPMDLDAIMHRNNNNNHNSSNNRYNNRNNNRNNRGRGRQHDPSLTCFHCKKTGHTTKNCYIRAIEIMHAFDKLDLDTRRKLFKNVGVLNCILDVEYMEEENHGCDCSQCQSSNKASGSSYLLSLCDKIADEKRNAQMDDLNQVIAMMDASAVSSPVLVSVPVIPPDNVSVPVPDNNKVVNVVSPPSLDQGLVSNTVEEKVDSNPVVVNSNARRPVELTRIIHDLDMSTTVDLTTDSVYLTNLLNAANTSTLPLYGATIRLNRSPGVVNVKCLIDNGASENYISSRIARMIEGHRSVIHGREVETAGGNVSPINEKIVYDLNLQGHTSPMSAFVFDTKFDVILGRSWLKEHKPVADWFDDTWTLSCCGSGKTTISPTSSSCVASTPTQQPPELNYLVSHLQAEKMLKEEGTNACFLYMMDKGEKDGASTGIIQENVVWTDQLMKDFPTVFQDKLPGLPPNRQNFSHVINVPEGVNPINRPPFRMSPAELDELQRQLTELQSLGLIRPSSSPWGAPVLFVKKKNGEMRMCIDYRALNKVTIRNSTPLPRIDECLDRLQGASWFTCLDLRSGYHQIRLKDSDIPLTGFNTRYGKWEWLVLPFGLSNAPPSYQTWMNGVLKDCIDKFALVYLDDCCIFSKTKEDHIKHVRQVLSIFEKEGLIVNLKKCEFGKRELEFLGYKVSANGILPSSSKVKAIQDWPRPTNVQEVRQFVGLAQHYRRFCPNFSSVAAPLTELTHGNGAKKRAIVWNDQCEVSFKAIKQMLTSSPLLKLPDMRKPYRIETDSSDFGVGAVLLQEDSDSSAWLPIAYESKKLSPAEQKLPAQERELIAIIHALRTWRCFVDGCQGGYTVYSDHKPLIYFKSQLNPTPRLVRWIADYEAFSPNIEYKAGKDNQVADALSRKPDLLVDNGEDIPSLAPEYLYAAWDQLSDTIKSDWPILYVNKNYEKMKSDVLRKRMEKEEDQFVVRQRTVYRLIKTEEGSVKQVKFIPFSDRADLVFKYHEAFGHAGIKTMLKMLTERYWWPGLRKDILDWLKTCTACQLNSRRDHVHQDVMHPLQIPQAFDRWHLDFVGELPTTGNGNKWLLTAVDYLTNWPIARSVPVASTEAVADFIYEEIVMRFGCPSEIVTDRGANFTSGLVAAYTKRVGTNHKLTSAFHPRTNSKVEPYNGVIKQMLRKYVNGAIHRWDDFVHAALWASRIRVHSTTGFSPYYLVYGREPRLPGDILRPYITKEMLLNKRTVADLTSRELELLGQHRAAAEFRLKAMGEADKKRWDAKIKPTNFEIGDMVMLTHEGKFGLEPRYKGPYIVTKVFPDFGTYQLETVTGEPLQSLVHVDRLKAAKGDKPTEPWYDPTSSRRAVREADRLRIESNTNSIDSNGTTTTTASSSTPGFPSNLGLNQPQDDFIDMPVPIHSTPTHSSTTPPTTAITTTTTESPNNTQYHHIVAQQQISDEDSSLHGSSVMDEIEDNEHGLDQITDGYDFSSLADSDIEIPDQPSAPSPPPVMVPSSSFSTTSSYMSSQSTVSNTSDDAAINETVSVDTDLELDERVSEPENTDMVPDLRNEPHVVPPASPPSVSQATPEPDSTTIVNFFPPTDTNQTPIVLTSRPGPPKSTFVFKTPAIPKIHTQNETTQPAKSVDLSSHMPNTATGSSSSSDVQGRTFVSKGGDVRVEGYSDSDLDLQDIIDRLNTNKNKKRRFKPRAPATRNIKQRLTWIAHNITQTILDKINVQI
ncbi:uncharacterized protein ATC70_012229 [Mucor velutinosus]|uniref:Reverse transcriptase n=1 Tax=Mucor velutinosus TaxID=708070 RepID=A0AAN7HKG6_9FUNG|nr:hypothetical protein ATC70_012229 [Mucor velutinosus]